MRSKNSQPASNEAMPTKAKPTAKAKSPVKARSKKKANPPPKVTKDFENGSKEITLQFPGPGEIINFEVREHYQTLCVGDLQLPTTPTPNHHVHLPLLNQNQDQTMETVTPQRSERRVTFDLTPIPPVNITPNQRDSPWLHSPSDAQSLGSDPFAPNADQPDTAANTPENFNYVFLSPLSPTKPPGPTRSQQKSTRIPSTPSTPSHPHHNHGYQDFAPQVGAPSPNEKSSNISFSPLKGSAGNQHRREAHDVVPFFSEEAESDRRICKLCQ